MIARSLLSALRTENRAEASTAVSRLLKRASLRRHDGNTLGRHTLISWHAGRQFLFFGGYLVEMFARARSAMEGGISPQGGVVIDHDAIGYALLSNEDIHAADDASLVVKKINIRPPEMFGDQHHALVGLQDHVDDFRVGDGNLSKRALAVNCCRHALGKHDRLLRRLLDREGRE